ncbi:MAG TPA: XisI protein [Pirellulales bacterium]|nr:XisI protein [Pirellulales bacterium]
MEPVIAYRQAVERVLSAYTNIPYAHGELRCEAIFDREHDRYALITLGWNAGKRMKRMHFPLVHIDIVGGKVWIERDTTEDGVADELVHAGIPKSQIVLAFRPPEVRKQTDYAVA